MIIFKGLSVAKKLAQTWESTFNIKCGKGLKSVFCHRKVETTVGQLASLSLSCVASDTLWILLLLVKVYGKLLLSSELTSHETKLHIIIQKLFNFHLEKPFPISLNSTINVILNMFSVNFLSFSQFQASSSKSQFLLKTEYLSRFGNLKKLI